GKTYRTRPLPIEVVDESAAGQQQAQQPQGSGSQAGERETERRAEGQIAKDDLLLRLVLSRTTVFKGEPVRAALKLYQRVPVVGSNGGKYPSFNGFWAQQLDTGEQETRRETYNGKIYEATTLVEYLLYPQQSGELTIDPAELTVVVQVVVQNNRRNDPFFGNMPDIYNVERRLQTGRVTVNVKPLPAGAPSSFSGAVGKFTMESQMPAAELAANSAATYTVKIAGSGNLSFVQAPKLVLPQSFEQYTVKTTESIRSSQGGMSGYRQFEYPFIARAEGEYEIAPVEFTFFNPSTMQYETLSSLAFTIDVAPDAAGGEPTRIVSGLSKEDVRMLGRDIRFIKLGKAGLTPIAAPFVFSGAYFLLLALILVFFAALYVALRKRIRDNRNTALVRGRRANKVAVQRFRAAARYMKENNRRAFYEEMLRAVWGYMGDKLNIPVANLTKENVREELHKRGVDVAVTQRFSEIVTRCEEAQYSPAGESEMAGVYADGVDFVSKIESAIKR
ncbi:MAG: BatD family protein, partial [Alistipes sp.]|nr:BatD family protein [Alistipes sp.]